MILMRVRQDDKLDLGRPFPFEVIYRNVAAADFMTVNYPDRWLVLISPLDDNAVALPDVLKRYL